MSTPGPAPAAKKIKLLAPLPPLRTHVRRARAVQTTTGREVEFRILPERPSPEVLQAFAGELEDLSLLDHTGLLPLLDRGVTRGHHYYLVPARDARTLQAVVDDPAVDLRERVRCLRSLAGVLGALHLLDRPLGHLDADLVAWDAAQARCWFLHTRQPPRDEVPGEYPVHWPEDAGPGAEPSLRGDLFHWARLAYRLVCGGKDPFASGPGELVPLAEACPQLARPVADAIESALGWNPVTRMAHACELDAYLRSTPGDLAVDHPAPAGSAGEAGDEVGREAAAGGEAAPSREDEVADSHGAEAARPPETADADGALEISTHAAPGFEGPVTAADLAASQAGTRIHATMEHLRKTGQVAIPKRVGLASAAVVTDDQQTELARAAAVFFGAVLLGLAARAVFFPPPPPPLRPAPTYEDEGPARKAWIAPSTQAEFLEDPQLRRLLNEGPTSPETFQRRWALLRSLVLTGRLPESFVDTDRVLGMLQVYKQDPTRGAAALDEYRAELNQALGSKPTDP